MVVHKTVTVLFCDLTGSTPLGERTDPEVMWRVLQRYFTEMRTVVERHGGTVEKFIGDAVMAVFGVPSVHEDDAFRAIRAAAEMQSRLSDLNGQLERRHGVRIQARIGVNTGRVVASEVPQGDALVTGDVVNVAKRLEESATAGEVLLGDLTRRLAGEAVEVREPQALSLKGKSSPTVAWPLVRVVSDAALSFGRGETPLVGRTSELARLRKAYGRAVRAGNLELVLVLGPAGIGKSRLAREFCGVVSPTANVVTGRCLPYGEGITFWPLAEIVRQIGAGRLETALADDPDATLLAKRLRGLIGAGDAATGSSEELFWAVRRFFEALARDRPLVVCLEDVHWAEPTLLELIEYLRASGRGAPVLLLALARPEVLDRHPSLGDLRQRVERIVLEPLLPAEADVLLDLLADERELDDETRRRVAERAEGNPLFIEQISAMLAEAGPGSEPFAVPPSIQALISARLDRLPDDQRTVLERGAIVGRDFPLGAVERLLPEDLSETANAHLISLTRSGLVRPVVSTFAEGEAFRFRHALIRDVAYERLSKELRAELHERFADWLEANAGRRLTEVEEIVGYHLEQSYRYREQLGPIDEAERGLATRGGELLGAAGRRALARSDIPAAINLLDRARSLVTSRHSEYLELLRDLSSASWTVGDIDVAEALLDDLLGEATRRGDARFEWSARLERAGRRHITDPDASANDLLDVAEHAIIVFERLGDHRELARAWRRLSLVPRAQGHYDASRDSIERALRHATRADDPQEQARLATHLCAVLFLGPTSAAEAADRARKLLAGVPRSPLLEANVATSLAGLEAMRGEFAEARALCARGERIYAELGLEMSIVDSTEMAGYVELLAGDAQAAEQSLRRGYDMLAPKAKPALLALPAALLAEAFLEQGRVEEAERFARLSEDHGPRDDVETQVRWRRAGALIAALGGRRDEAERLGREAVDLVEGTDALNLRADALTRLGQVLRTSGAEEEALTLFRSGLELYEQKGNVVSAARTAGLVAAAVA